MTAGCRLPAVALALALAVPGLPIARGLSVVCDRCPPACPMHRKARKGPGCHHAPPATRATDPHRSCARTPGLMAPGCGVSGDLPLLSLGPALLPASTLSWPLGCRAAPRPSPPVVRSRAPDPPETPPPIASA